MIMHVTAFQNLQSWSKILLYHISDFQIHTCALYSHFHVQILPLPPPPHLSPPPPLASSQTILCDIQCCTTYNNTTLCNIHCCVTRHCKYQVRQYIAPEQCLISTINLGRVVISHFSDYNTYLLFPERNEKHPT